MLSKHTLDICGGGRCCIKRDTQLSCSTSSNWVWGPNFFTDALKHQRNPTHKQRKKLEPGGLARTLGKHTIGKGRFCRGHTRWPTSDNQAGANATRLQESNRKRPNNHNIAAASAWDRLHCPPEQTAQHSKVASYPTAGCLEGLGQRACYLLCQQLSRAAVKCGRAALSPLTQGQQIKCDVHSAATHTLAGFSLHTDVCGLIIGQTLPSPWALAWHAHKSLLLCQHTPN